ncbi:putative protein kinase RLK-Pelle-CrRLK1L-1 family [Helianthus annuus]|nr:putative protein kinase RLK-Pelle-CrRLK1L-1 family [Helianthus annuus]
MILVIDNFYNGFLSDYLKNLKDKSVLTWEKRLKICIDVAHGLHYIHSQMEDQKMIINRDICSYNIGLDENRRAKIVYFGDSVFLPPHKKNEALYLKWIGRKYNTDPEYRKTNKVKRESDVYGFGVILFEILCGRLAYDPIYLKESDKGLAHVARRSFRTRTLEEMIDPIIKEEIGENNFVLNRGPNKDSLHTFITIAHQCVAETQDQRPTMKVIVKELEKAVFFQVSHCIEDRAHHPDMHHIVTELENALELEKALEFQLRHENIVRPFFLGKLVFNKPTFAQLVNNNPTYRIGI